MVEQLCMELDGAFGRMPARPVPYRRYEGALAAFGCGPEGKHCGGCAHFNASEKCCRLLPVTEVRARGRACGRYKQAKRRAKA